MSKGKKNKNTCPVCCVAVTKNGRLAACSRPSVHRNRCIECWAIALECTVDEARVRFGTVAVH